MIHEFSAYDCHADQGELRISDQDNFGDYYELKLMQFTGLTDKNGVEIYEGDVVCWKHLDSYGMVYYNEDEVHYFAKPIRSEDATESYLDSNYMEVIGNIHENPELIKLK